MHSPECKIIYSLSYTTKGPVVLVCVDYTHIHNFADMILCVQPLISDHLS